MIISRKEVAALSSDIRRIIDGHSIDLRDNLEGRLSMLKNDIHTLAGRLNEQAENLQKEKAAMANTLADISHQLKTPLTAMTVMVELLENAPPEKRAEFILNLKQGLTQTEWLANALLKMAKLESGSAALNPVYIPTNELVDTALAPLRILLDIKDQRINLAGEALLYCDKNWTVEAITNIVKNASEHSPEGGAIDIAVGANPISNWIAITDSGPGIPSQDIKDLFKRFGNSRKGIGIGLALSLAIMRGQGGDIEVNGGGGSRGATFTFKFYAKQGHGGVHE
ncbi:MAG: HAMP domain-containing histidine kinase [Defluviitaleaceae bacterium]|nr:HAMP domain-containing histidine kinase [Defluviitaleaceae bacterium]